MTAYQPYYLAYAAAHHSTPEEMEKGPRGNAEYLAWMRARWNDFYALRPELFEAKSAYSANRPNPLPEAHDVFGDWLAAKYHAEAVR